ncbi:uncharacterized protein LOC116202341 [Punica granatum]|uniref:Uncharacterized protein LOC116202341 n=1 Tax=Punica granatum TaxID=22663 RepID=A0A6P8DEH5_PUNGR|nr:uncharacterized protein LOC116202341 [Punica granatum]
MAVFRLLLPAIFTSLFALFIASAEFTQRACSIRFSDGSNSDCELQDLKLRVAQLESILEESIQNLNTKSLYLDGREQLIEETSQKIHFLQSTLTNIKDDSTNADKWLSSLEEEVRLLWASSRKNNFDLHVLQSKVQESEDALTVLTSQVEKLSDIVSEQWIQIQHLEQALQITEMRTLEAQRRVGSSRCTFIKFINSVYHNQLKKVFRMLDQLLSCEEATSSSVASQALHHLKNVFSALNKYHHELQGFIKKLMERNEVTAALASEELVFFMASAVVVFPIMTALLWLSSALC